MSVDDPTTVDGMGFRPEDDRFELVIQDHRDWDDPDTHLAALGAKVNAYLSFLASGQQGEVYPERPASAFLGPWIRIVFVHRPPAPAVDTLAGLAEQLATGAITLSYDIGVEPDRVSYLFK